MLIDQLGLKRKPLPASELPPPPASPARRWGIRLLLFGALVALTVLAFPERNSYLFNVVVGDTWREESLVAPFSYPILKTDEAIEQERRSIRFETPPFFREVRDAVAQMQQNRDTLRLQMEAIAEAYVTYRRALARGLPTAPQDSLRFESLRRDARLKLSREQWGRLLGDYIARIEDLAPPGVPLRGGVPLFDRLLTAAFERAMATTSTLGVIDIPRDSVFTDVFFIRNESERVDEPRQKDNVFGINEAYADAQAQLALALPEDEEQVAIATALFRALFQPSLSFMREETEAEWARKERRLSPTIGAVLEGDPIIERGQRITEERYSKLRSLGVAQTERGGTPFTLRHLAGKVMLAVAILFLFYLYLYLLRRQIFDDDRMLLLATLVLGIIIGLFAVALRLEDVRPYAVPVAVASVLLTVLFDSRVGVFGTLSLALVGGHLVGDDLEFTFATLFACTLVVFSVRDIKNRGQIFLAAGMLFAAYAFVLGTMRLLLGISTGSLEQDLLYAGVNAFLLLFAYPLVWVFERLFGVTTDLTLLELSNTNRPLLRELSQRAPGTFNHVLQVANLAEACADAVGANALLTRVGALYHDIGKMRRPEMFIENQGGGVSPHTQMPPALSASYIIEHVTEGLQIGRKYRLPEPVLQFIPTHHGTTRVEFFYRKALDQENEAGPDVSEADFRYPGPRPTTKETAILMLADSTEAASRTLDDPTPENLARLVDGLVKARVNDHQFDRSDLTFSDLTRIRETLLKMLTSIHHSRIKYPEPVVEQDEPAPYVTRITPPAGAGDGEPAPPAPASQSKSEQDMK